MELFRQKFKKLLNEDLLIFTLKEYRVNLPATYSQAAIKVLRVTGR
ncbi:MAG: hypothetical protein CM15mV110_080 [Caudoviricetes sp.]|nr:MAG: hypothetical protein CM15mV110_080 [Caudoviricetes sp.]